MIMFEKFGQHQPLNRQAERYALEGVPIALSTMADAVGSVCAALDPLLRLVEAHVMAAERLHGDDTTVPVLAMGKCDVGAMLGLCARTTGLSAARDPPAAMFYYSRDRRGEHPQAHLASYSGILQADALADTTNSTSPSEVLGRSGKRPVGSMPGARSSPWRILRKTRGARLRARRRSPSRRLRSRSCAASTPCSRSSARSMAKSADHRKAVRQAQSAPLVADLEAYMREQCAKLSRGHDLAKAMNYMFKRWALLHTLPRRWPRLPLEQCRRKSAARHRIGQKVVVILRVRPRRAPRRRHV